MQVQGVRAVQARASPRSRDLLQSCAMLDTESVQAQVPPDQGGVPTWCGDMRMQLPTGQRRLALGAPHHTLLRLACQAQRGMRAQVCLLTNPVWVIKTRLQLQRGAGWLARPGTALPAAARRYRGVAHAAREIAREEGFRGFYRGIWPSLLLVRARAGIRAAFCNLPSAERAAVLGEPAGEGGPI